MYILLQVYVGMYVLLHRICWYVDMFKGYVDNDATNRFNLF